MAQNIDDILAELRARTDKKLEEEKQTAKVPERTAPVPVSAPAAEEAPACPVPEAPAPEVPAEEPLPPVSLPVPEPEKPAAPPAEPELEKDIGELYQANFGSEAGRDSREMRKQAHRNRRAMMDKSSGKKRGFFGTLLEFVGFLLLVLLVILAVLLLLQTIADVEIVPVEALTREFLRWFSGLFPA